MIMNMQHYSIQLPDLPHEILLMIFKNLTNIEVLYTLIGVHIQLDKILSDTLFTEHLILIQERLPNGIIKLMDDSILDRFCSQIIPKIDHKIKLLTLDSSSMKRILFSATYPHLHQLLLFNIEYKTFKELLDEATHLNTIKNQITILNITINTNKREEIRSNTVCILLTHIFTVFNNLKCLQLHPYCDAFLNIDEGLSCKLRGSPTFNSTNLIELRINVAELTECYYLLDGRFENLHSLYVNVHLGDLSLPELLNQAKTITLKRFSLTSKLGIFSYEDGLVPLLRRMSNIEELVLNTVIYRSNPNESFINGNNLKNDIISHMPMLNNFVFSIHTQLFVDDSLINIPSNENIQHTFKDLEHYQINFYTDYFPRDEFVHGHMYSIPYTMNYFDLLSHSFPGGLFLYVNKISLVDQHPFEHEFFIRIARSFPYLKILIIDNQSPQNNEECQQSKKDNHTLPIIEYSHLTYLNLLTAHNYIEQFLDNTKTCLSNDIILMACYCCVEQVISNLTRTRTQSNCIKVKYLHNIARSDVPSHFYTYFPNLESN